MILSKREHPSKHGFPGRKTRTIFYLKKGKGHQRTRSTTRGNTWQYVAICCHTQGAFVLAAPTRLGLPVCSSHAGIDSKRCPHREGSGQTPHTGPPPHDAAAPCHTIVCMQHVGRDVRDRSMHALRRARCAGCPARGCGVHCAMWNLDALHVRMRCMCGCCAVVRTLCGMCARCAPIFTALLAAPPPPKPNKAAQQPCPCKVKTPPSMGPLSRRGAGFKGGDQNKEATVDRLAVCVRVAYTAHSIRRRSAPKRWVRADSAACGAGAGAARGRIARLCGRGLLLLALISALKVPSVLPLLRKGGDLQWQRSLRAPKLRAEIINRCLGKRHVPHRFRPNDAGVVQR